MPRSVLGHLDGWLKLIAACFVVMLLCTVTAGIVFRGAGHPLSWTDEASGFLMVWLACLGWMIATRNHAHIRIRFFLDMLPSTPWRGTEVVLQAGVALLGGVIAWYSVHLIKVNSDIEATTMPLAVAWMYVPLLPAGLLTLGQALGDLWLQVSGHPDRSKSMKGRAA
jgi:TRAP-type C4-dicarboxylate transport system permease small subunit